MYVYIFVCTIFIQTCMYLRIYICCQNTYAHIYMCRYIIFTCNARRDRDVCLISFLFERGVGVYAVCACVYAQTLHVGLFNLSPGVGMRHEESRSTKCPHTSMPHFCTKHIKTSLFCSKKREKSKHNIETSNPAGFEQTDPTGRVLDYLCK